MRWICGVSLADQIRNEEVRRIAGTREDVTVRMKKNVLSCFGHVVWNEWNICYVKNSLNELYIIPVVENKQIPETIGLSIPFKSC